MIAFGIKMEDFNRLADKIGPACEEAVNNDTARTIEFEQKMLKLFMEFDKEQEELGRVAPVVER